MEFLGPAFHRTDPFHRDACRLQGVTVGDKFNERGIARVLGEMSLDTVQETVGKKIDQPVLTPEPTPVYRLGEFPALMP